MKNLYLFDLDYTILKYSRVELSFLSLELFFDLFLEISKNGRLDKKNFSKSLRKTSFLEFLHPTYQGSVFHHKKNEFIRFRDFYSITNFRTKANKDDLGFIIDMIEIVNENKNDFKIVPGTFGSTNIAIFLFLSFLLNSKRNRVFHDEKNLTDFEWFLAEELAKRFISENEIWQLIESTLVSFTEEYRNAYFQRIVAQPSIFITNLDEINQTFDLIKKLKEKGKTVLVTNSDYWYVDTILSQIYGKEFINIFDAFITMSKKPEFFCHINLKDFTNQKKDKFYEGGSYNSLVKLLGLDINCIRDTFLFEDSFLHGIIMPKILKSDITPVFIDNFNEKNRIGLDGFNSMIQNKKILEFGSLIDSLESILNK